MALFQQKTLQDLYQYYLDQGDPRLKDWPLMSTPWDTLAILVSYWLSLVLIRAFMKNRKPFELKTFMFGYNLIQVALSLYMFIEIATLTFKSNYGLVCQPVDYSDDPLAVRMASVIWVGFFSKVIDLVDTIVFALRKKDNQITFLHVYHHSTILAASWFGCKYVAGGNSFILLFLNSFVHTVMYAYYGLASFGPHMQKYLWWKKYLTQMQLFQFVTVMVHSLISFLTPGCGFPKAFSLFYIVYGLTLLLLFSNFYVQSYNKGKKRSLDSKQVANDAGGNSISQKKQH